MVLILFIAAKRHSAEVALRRADASRASSERLRRSPLQEGVWVQIADRHFFSGRKLHPRGKRKAVPPPDSMLYIYISL